MFHWMMSWLVSAMQYSRSCYHQMTIELITSYKIKKALIIRMLMINALIIVT